MILFLFSSGLLISKSAPRLRLTFFLGVSVIGTLKTSDNLSSIFFQLGEDVMTSSWTSIHLLKAFTLNFQFSYPYRFQCLEAWQARTCLTILTKIIAIFHFGTLRNCSFDRVASGKEVFFMPTKRKMTALTRGYNCTKNKYVFSKRHICFSKGKCVF